jgi:cytochrome c556
MATGFLASMDEVYARQERSSAPDQVKNGYNLMVEACMNCHRSYCPGPMVRIKKLYITKK